jgi:predicted 3-demethylubiquinone-9 3-methyltransferase (glyoxalase superfamily)
MPQITPCLWFENHVEEAIKFYTSIFPNSKIISISPITSIFEINGQRIMILQSPGFKLNESISLYVDCTDQAEVDFYWNKLISDGGSESNCGWLKDKYGLSWQIIPKQLGELMSDSNQEKANKVMQAMLKMNKIIVADLEQAYNS